MAREWLLRGVDPEDLKPTSQEEVYQTPRSRWENFWYHHKLKFWLISFAVVVLVILVVQLVTRDAPDYQVLFITERTYADADLDELAAYLQQFGADLDGDGKVEVQIENCSITADQSRNSSIQQIQAHLVAGDRTFYIWDVKGYEYFENNVISQYEGESYLSAISVQDAGLIEDGTVWSWAEDDRRSAAMKKRWPDLYFGVRYAGASAESQQLHKENYALLEALIANEKPKK